MMIQCIHLCSSAAASERCVLRWCPAPSVDCTACIPLPPTHPLPTQHWPAYATFGSILRSHPTPPITCWQGLWQEGFAVSNNPTTLWATDAQRQQQVLRQLRRALERQQKVCSHSTRNCCCGWVGDALHSMHSQRSKLCAETTPAAAAATAPTVAAAGIWGCHIVGISCIRWQAGCPQAAGRAGSRAPGVACAAGGGGGVRHAAALDLPLPLPAMLVLGRQPAE